MSLKIISKNRKKLFKVFVAIMDFLYLALGVMPKIVLYMENNERKNLNQLVCRFFTAKQFFRNDHLIDITSNTLNEQVLKDINTKFINKKFKVFWSFTALTSTAYEKIYSEHKITLLLHCLEGYIYNKAHQYKKLKFKKKISEIISLLFDYDKKFDSEIIKTFKVSEKEYLNMLSDTRDQFSHYIAKKNPLIKGKNYMINFVLLHYIFRIYLLKEIDLKPKEKNIAEFLYSFYDWINILKNKNFTQYKSRTYKNNLRRILNTLYKN